MSYKIGTNTIEKNSNGEKTIESTLDARFDFWNETAPRDRKKVKHKIKELIKKAKKNSLSMQDIPDEYIVNKNEDDYSGFMGKTLLGLGFYVYLFSCKKVHLEEKVNFDAINNYILTGKNPDEKY